MTDKLTILGPNSLHELDHKQYSTIWSEAFGEKWNAKIFPYSKDDVISAYYADVLIGFCMVHDRPPQPFERAPKYRNYVYNLCISPEHQGKGYGTCLLDYCKSYYKQLTIHLTLDPSSNDLEWLQKRGFQVLDTWYGKYIEHVYPPINQEKKEVQVPNISEYYDYEENIMYMQP